MARDLSGLIQDHPVTHRYREALLLIKDDAGSLELLTRLIGLGKELDRKAREGKDVAADSSPENEYLRRELAGNDLVKTFIASQKEYLNLVREVIDRIKNPRED